MTGEPRWDALGPLTIGVLLVAIAVLLAEHALRSAVPTAHHVFIEPDIYRATSPHIVTT